MSCKHTAPWSQSCVAQLSPCSHGRHAGGDSRPPCFAKGRFSPPGGTVRTAGRGVCRAPCSRGPVFPEVPPACGVLPGTHPFPSHSRATSFAPIWKRQAGRWMQASSVSRAALGVTSEGIGGCNSPRRFEQSLQSLCGGEGSERTHSTKAVWKGLFKLL